MTRGDLRSPLDRRLTGSGWNERVLNGLRRDVGKLLADRQKRHLRQPTSRWR